MTIATASTPPASFKPMNAAPFQGHWLTGNIHELRQSPLSLYEKAWRARGDYISVRAVPGYCFALLAHPDAIEHVLQKNSKNYRKPDLLNTPLRELFGDGLVTSEGDFWRRQRKLIQPAFTRQHTARFSTVITEAAEAVARSWGQADSSQPMDILPEMMRLSLRIAGMALFSQDMSGDADVLGQIFREAFEQVGQRMNAMTKLPRWIPTPGNRKFQQVKSRLQEAIKGIVDRRRSDSSPHADLLSTFLTAHDDETNTGMTDGQLASEMLTMLAASHDTVGAALSWTWYLLAQHPEIQEQLHDEVNSQLHGQTPTATDLPRLPMARAVFEESMRLYPPAPGVMREAIAADNINGFPIKKKQLVVPCQYLVHRHPEFWPNPQQFDPQRFIDPVVISARPKLAYFPFGAGPRVCIGQTFAMTEGPLVLAILAQRFRMTLVPNQTILPDTTFTLKPKPAVKVFLHKR